MPGIPFTKDDPRINREGRPVGVKNFTTKVREALEQIAEGKNYTYEEAFIKSILKKGIVDGEPAIQRLIWNYLDGMPVQRIGNPDGSNLIPIPLFDNVSKKDGISDNNSDQPNKETEE